LPNQRPGLASDPSSSIELTAVESVEKLRRRVSAEWVNDKIKAWNKQEINASGLVLISPDKLSGMEKNRNYSVKMEKSWPRGE
jgi:hypothetical protein